MSSNTALITGKNSQMGLYLQYNGGMDSVAPFLEYACLHNPFGLGEDVCDRGLITLATVVNNFMRTGSVYVVDVNPEAMNDDNDDDNFLFDNGIYIVDGKWNIVHRLHAPQKEEQRYDRAAMLLSIDQAQPASMQLGKAFLEKEVIPFPPAK